MKTRFDKYELIEKIGAGGMAEIYLARSLGAEGLEKRVVIKRVQPELAGNPRFVEMFIAEARIAMGLNHPNIVQIYDFGKVDDDFYLAMEYVEGWDLGRVLSAQRRGAKPLSMGDALFVAQEVAKGLHYAHRRNDEFGRPLGLVHRDISPQNVLISRDGTVKIVDFGIAKATIMADESPRMVKGKFSYMSPEQASGLEVDSRSDLFSLGVVLFEMICGRELFKQNTNEQTLSLVKSAVVPDLASLNPDIPPKLEHLLYKLLAREPEDRQQTARELQLELGKLLLETGEMHDAYTVAEYIARIEGELERASTAKVSSPRGVEQSSTREHERTSVVSTATKVMNTEERRSSAAEETTPGPLTPSLAGTTEPVELQTRER
ncbi:MAG: serine/threonine-protein kinase, partial [Myxococcota bacterium]